MDLQEQLDKLAIWAKIWQPQYHTPNAVYYHLANTTLDLYDSLQ